MSLLSSPLSSVAALPVHSPGFRRSAGIALLLMTGLLAAPSPGMSQQVYNNLTTTLGFQANGGAPSATGNTTLLADDITFAAGTANLNVNSFSLAIGNGGSTAAAASLTVEFFATNGANNGPGTLLGSSTVAANFGSGVTTQMFTATNIFTIPANGQIWAGFYFSGTTGSTQAVLNSLGAIIENPPAIGSSNASTIFAGTAPATTGSNPAGSITTVSNSGQPSNFGMAFAVPEPSSIVFTALAGAGLLGWAARRRA